MKTRMVLNTYLLTRTHSKSVQNTSRYQNTLFLNSPSFVWGLLNDYLVDPLIKGSAGKREDVLFHKQIRQFCSQLPTPTLNTGEWASFFLKKSSFRLPDLSHGWIFTFTNGSDGDVWILPVSSEIPRRRNGWPSTACAWRPPQLLPKRLRETSQICQDERTLPL